MKGDIPQAAFSLLNRLPVHTHYAKEPVPRHILQKMRKLQGDVRTRGQKCRPIECDGVVYPSRTLAKKEMRISSVTLTRLLDTGKARYVD